MDPRQSDRRGCDFSPPRRRFSQNFLVDRAVAQRIVDRFAPQPTDTVIEVGPGRAILTEILTERTGDLWAVEIDRDLVVHLRHRFPALGLIEGDILEIPLASITATPGRVIANLPYGISTQFVLKLLAESADFSDAQLLLQREFADRLAAKVGEKAFGALTVSAQLGLEVTLGPIVPAQCFRPAPRVQSRILNLRPRPARPSADEQARLRTVLRAAFSGRRKRIAKALTTGLGVLPEVVTGALLGCGIDPSVRAEGIPPEQWLELVRGPLGDALSAGHKAVPGTVKRPRPGQRQPPTESI